MNLLPQGNLSSQGNLSYDGFNKLFGSSPVLPTTGLLGMPVSPTRVPSSPLRLLSPARPPLLLPNVTSALPVTQSYQAPLSPLVSTLLLQSPVLPRMERPESFSPRQLEQALIPQLLSAQQTFLLTQVAATNSLPSTEKLEDLIDRGLLTRDELNLLLSEEARLSGVTRERILTAAQRNPGWLRTVLEIVLKNRELRKITASGFDASPHKKKDLAQITELAHKAILRKYLFDVIRALSDDPNKFTNSSTEDILAILANYAKQNSMTLLSLSAKFGVVAPKDSLHRYGQILNSTPVSPTRITSVTRPVPASSTATLLPEADREAAVLSALGLKPVSSRHFGSNPKKEEHPSSVLIPASSIAQYESQANVVAEQLAAAGYKPASGHALGHSSLLQTSQTVLPQVTGVSFDQLNALYGDKSLDQVKNAIALLYPDMKQDLLNTDQANVQKWIMEFVSGGNDDQKAEARTRLYRVLSQV